MKARRYVAVWSMLVLLSVMLPVTVKASEETRKKIDQAEQEKKETESKLDETEENLDKLNEQKDSLQGALTTLNTELSQVSNNLSDLETKITDKEAEIEAMNQEIARVQEELQTAIQLKDDQYEAMKQQIKFIYERSDYLYLELFFSAGSFSDFLNKNNYIEQLSAYEEKVLQAYKDAQAAMEAKEEELQMAMDRLEQDKAELSDYKVQVVAEQSRVSGLVSKTANSISATASQISEAEAAALAYEQKIKEQEENITALKAKLAEEIRMAQLAAQSSWRDISEVSFAEGDRYLLANLIYCEAGGEPYAGQVAVGSVVINRVLSSVYPDTVTGVIYQNKQFSPVASGRLALALAEGRATGSCYQAADEVHHECGQLRVFQDTGGRCYTQIQDRRTYFLLKIRGMTRSCPNIIFSRFLQFGEFAAVDQLQQTIQTQQGRVQHVFGEDTGASGRDKLIQIHHLHEAVSIDDHIHEKIGKNISIRSHIKGMVDNVTVPEEHGVILPVETADLKPFRQVIAGTAVMQIFAGLEGVPAGHDHLIIPVQDDIVFEQHTFVGYQSFAV